MSCVYVSDLSDDDHQPFGRELPEEEVLDNALRSVRARARLPNEIPYVHQHLSCLIFIVPKPETQLHLAWNLQMLTKC